MRVFKPTGIDIGSVLRWEYTRSRGLRVVYKDGLRANSAWGSLPEFLKAIRDGREFAREVEPYTCPLCGQHITDEKPCGCGAR